MAKSVSVQLEFDSSPADGSLIEALQGIQVTRGEKAPSTFSITFHDERRHGSNDFPLMGNPQLQPFTRTRILTTVDGSTEVLIDGYLTGRQLAPAPGPGGTTLTVSGEDVSVKMDMIQISFDYPHMGDFLIVEAILAKYVFFRVEPDAHATVADVVPFSFVPQQNGTDRQFLQQLAEKHGYRFYMRPGRPSRNWSQAYWGPPDLGADPQKALTVDMGPATNVETIQFGENVLAPTMTYATVPQNTIAPPAPQSIPVAAAASTRSPALAEDPVMGSYGEELLSLITDPLNALKHLLELDVRGSLFQTQGLGPAQDQSLGVLQALVGAQGLTNDSTDEVVTAQGTLSTARYGAVLEAPGVVAVRGAGHACDGLYYVKQVEHTMVTKQGSWQYQQQFTLTREGMGSTIEEVPTNG